MRPRRQPWKKTMRCSTSPECLEAGADVPSARADRFRQTRSAAGADGVGAAQPRHQMLEIPFLRGWCCLSARITLRRSASSTKPGLGEPGKRIPASLPGSERTRPVIPRAGLPRASSPHGHGGLHVTMHNGDHHMQGLGSVTPATMYEAQDQGAPDEQSS